MHLVGCDECDCEYTVSTYYSCIRYRLHPSCQTRPPVGVLTMVGMLADKAHKTMHYADTDESMV